MDNLNFILPEIFISLSIMFLLLLGVFKRNSQNLIYNLSVGSLLITGVLIYNSHIDENILLFNSSYIIDDLSSGYRESIHDKAIFVEGSIVDDLALSKCFEYNPNYVIHLAALFANQNRFPTAIIFPNWHEFNSDVFELF